MEKLTRTAQKLDKVIKFLFVLTVIIGFIVLISMIAWLVIFCSEVPLEMTSSLTLGSVQFQLTEAYLPTRTTTFVYYLLSFLVGLLAFALTAVRLKLIRNILKPMKEAAPFHNAVSANLKKLGWVEIVSGIFVNICNMIQTAILAKSYDLQAIFIGDSISRITLETKIDLAFVLIACVLFLASYIFRYGEELQMLSDETL